jgi:hypothetical protein
MVFEVEGVVIINPCPHWNDERWNGGQRGLSKACVLPTVKIPKDMLGGYVDVAANNSLVRRVGGI